MIDLDLMRGRLNAQQLEAVTYGEGPLLILAGAGSGKTRVITHRIAYLIGAIGARPDEVVAMTFTNKAAAEMRERVERLVGHELLGAFVGTFHSFGLRVLRQNAAAAGYPSSFVIYDQTDQLAAVRDGMKSLAIDDKSFSARQILAWISRRKNELVTPEQASERARLPHDRVYSECYTDYEERLARASALDFDDLLVQVIRLFMRDRELAREYSDRIRWLLVDEFQDTNPIQNLLVKQLTATHRNVCCVGDEDQSIYSFRGADIRNILDFERDFPDATIIKLEQNYRSTGTVLGAASAVISNNLDRHEKTLWTENPRGSRISLTVTRDDREEADFVVDEMLRLSREHGISLEQCAILYRTNATSRLFEDRLTSRDIPYRIYGGLRFYARKEIKDILAWLRMLAHPESDQDFIRVTSTPPRGIGAKTLELVSASANDRRVCLYSATESIVAGGDSLPTRSQKALGGLLSTIKDLGLLVEGMSTAGTVTSVIEGIGYPVYLEKAHPTDHSARAENLEALVSAAQEHDDADAPNGLVGFLDRVSLRSDTDSMEGEKGPSLMTVHSAKGLEFDAVFLAGLNEDLFPHSMSVQEENGLEEERRLAYVAITRARQHLALTAARFRYRFGEPVLCEPSRFLSEIPQELIRAANRTAAPPRGAREPLRFRKPGSIELDSKHPHEFELPQRTPPAPAAGLSRRNGRLTYESEPAAIHDETPFTPGMRVIHPAFGPGKVLGASGQGRRLTLDIRFERAGRKRILPAFTTLMPG